MPAKNSFQQLLALDKQVPLNLTHKGAPLKGVSNHSPPNPLHHGCSTPVALNLGPWLFSAPPEVATNSISSDTSSAVLQFSKVRCAGNMNFGWAKGMTQMDELRSLTSSNRPSQKESSISTINFQGLLAQYVSFREGALNRLLELNSGEPQVEAHSWNKEGMVTYARKYDQNTFKIQHNKWAVLKKNDEKI